MRSSGCIEGPCRRCDGVAEIGAEILGCSQFDLAAEDDFEFEFHLGEVQEAGCVAGLELH